MSCHFECDMFLVTMVGIMLGALYVFNDAPNENNIYLWDGNLD